MFWWTKSRAVFRDGRGARLVLAVLRIRAAPLRRFRLSYSYMKHNLLGMRHWHKLQILFHPVCVSYTVIHNAKDLHSSMAPEMSCLRSRWIQETDASTFFFFFLICKKEQRPPTSEFAFATLLPTKLENNRENSILKWRWYRNNWSIRRDLVTQTRRVFDRLEKSLPLLFSESI